MTYQYMATPEAFSIYGLRTPENAQEVDQTNMGVDMNVGMDMDMNMDMDAFLRQHQQQHQQQQHQQQQHQQQQQNSRPFVQPPPELPQSPPESVSVQPGSGHGHGYARLGGSASQSASGSGDGIRSSEEKEGEMEMEMGIGGGMGVEPDKRKAQNRAAQRAFRERKEKHVKDLQMKVAGLEDQTAALRTDNDRLKHELARVTAENEILRAVSNRQGGHGHGPGPAETRVKQEDGEPTVGPMRYKPMDLTTAPDLVAPGPGPGPASSPGSGSTSGPSPSSATGSDPSPASTTEGTGIGTGNGNFIHHVAYCPVTGDKLLDTRATWDLIQSHELAEQGLLDMEGLSARLKGMAKCNGQGPAFREGEVRKAIDESRLDHS